MQHNRLLPIPLAAWRLGLASAHAADVTYTCAECGASVLPRPMANGYLRRQCRCSAARNERAATRQLAFDTTSALARLRTSRTYTWLGALSEEPGLEQKTFADFEARLQPAAFRACQEYAASFEVGNAPPNVLLMGSVGTGKTHLAAAIANALRARGVGVLFATAPSLFDALYAADFERKADLLSRAASTSLLVLDDLDKLYIKPNEDIEQTGRYQKMTLFDILDRRYKRRLPSVITTNEQRHLEKWLDGATLDRLYERCLLLSVNGASYRQRKGGK